MQPLDRPQLVAFARESIARGSKSFAMASHLFDRVTRERAWLLYAWCRRCDDLADGQDHGGDLAPNHDAKTALALIRDLTARAFEGAPTGDPAFDCLGVVARESGLTPAMADDVIEGFALDAAEWRPRSEDDLYRYCYHVAGAVGVMMARVMGVAADDSDTLDRASDLGLAFQLANIARDLSEDDAAGRSYLPVEWLVEKDFAPGEALRPHNRAALATLAARLADRSQAYAASARAGAGRLPFRSRWAVLAAARIYGAIALKVKARGSHAWDHRTVIGKPAKIGHVAAALFEALRPAPVRARTGLWTRA